ncbi:hypothetical protein BKA57DRAFT_501387 [Linnemannia elongata]|nr:hypothetical protein BKA57DRAFT_501387 [Linnemannia elongata]
MQQGVSFKESRKQARAVGETSTWEIDEEDATTVSSIQGTTPNSDDEQGLAAVPQIHFNPDSTRRITLNIAGFDVGAAFRRLQEEAVPFINDESLKVSVKKVYLMLSANSIWDISERLPGMPADTHRSILSEIKPAVVRLSSKHTCLFLDLSYEFATTCRVRSRALETDEEEELLLLFLDLSKKLPSVALLSVADNEDTYSHGALDSLLSFFFPASDSDYHLWWANRPSIGSRERRGVREANKPDVTIMKEQFDVAFAEIKAPKDDGSIRLYIQDKWALTSLAKDTIDLHLRERRTITSIYCLQVFGYKLTVYELRFQAGLYMWTEIGTGYLPRDKNDTHCLIRCMELLKTLRVILILYSMITNTTWDSRL